jgi:hypothetical protein
LKPAAMPQNRDHCDLNAARLWSGNTPQTPLSLSRALARSRVLRSISRAYGRDVRQCTRTYENVYVEDTMYKYVIMTIYVRIYVLLMCCLGRYLNLYLPGLVTRVSLGPGLNQHPRGIIFGFLTMVTNGGCWFNPRRLVYKLGWLFFN